MYASTLLEMVAPDINEKPPPVETSASTSSISLSTDPQYATDNKGRGSPGWDRSEKEIAFWRDTYQRATYEGRHRFDPSYRWTPEEEKRLIRKVDLRIMLWAWIMFCALDFNRRNINRAITDNMLPELGESTERITAMKV